MTAKTLTRPDALRRIETTVTRHQGLLVPYAKETEYLNPIIRNKSISHAGWITTADGQYAHVHVHIKRDDAEELIKELNLSYDEFYELVKELGFQLSQKHLPWLCPKEMSQLTCRLGKLNDCYSSREDFGIVVGDHTDIDVYGKWIN